MSARRWLWGVFVSLAWTLASCGSARPAIFATETAQAATALAQQTEIVSLQTQMALQQQTLEAQRTFTPSPTLPCPPEYVIGVEGGPQVCDPVFLIPGGPGGTPMPGGYVADSNAPGWGEWFYNEQGDPIGQLRPGSSWSTLDERIVITGWVADWDLNLTTSRSLCTLHKWGHAWGPTGQLQICHAHVFDQTGEVLATFLAGLPFEVSGDVSFRTVPNSEGVLVNTSGRVITLLGEWTVR